MKGPDLMEEEQSRGSATSFEDQEELRGAGGMSWETISLGEFLTLKRGYALPEPQRQDGDVPVVSSSGITGYHNEAKVEGPGVVTGRYGTLGEVFYLDDPFWPLNTALYVKDFKGNNPRFTAYFLKNVLSGIASDKAAVPGVNRNDLHARRVIVTRDSIQQDRIASVLSAYDDLIENNRRRIQLLEQAARLLYREWFVRLRFPGHEHVRIKDGVPEGWAKGIIADLGKIITGKTPSTKTPENFGGNIPFVKTPDMHRSRIIVETEEYLSEKGAATQSNKTLPMGTILVACIGAKLGVVSITCLPCQTNQQINAVVPRKDYLTHYSLFALTDIKPRLEAMGGGATMPNVSKTKFASIPVLIPPQIILQEFDGYAKILFQQIQLLNRQNSCLIRGRDLLLPRLMNGEIAV